jgi:hypothetical protein
LLKNDFKGKTATDEISKTSQTKSFKAVFERLKIPAKKLGKVTHIGRKNGAKMAEFAGVPTNSIRQGGRWNNQALENCYLQSVPRDFLRSAAGFDPQRKNFFLPRASISPPEALKQQMFPDLVRWKENLHSHGDVTASLELLLKLLEFLSIVLLQDCCILMDAFPDFFLWEHPIFNNDQFLSFRRTLKASLETENSPIELRIQEVLPDVLARIDENSSRIQQVIRANEVKTDQILGT